MMASSLSTVELSNAFNQAPDNLLQKIHAAIKEHPHLTPLFVEVARFHLQSTSDAEEPETSPAKRRKLDNGNSTTSTATTVATSNGNGNGNGNSSAAVAVPESTTPLLDIADVSWSLPQRKKMHIRIVLHTPSPQTPDKSTSSTFSLLAIDSKTGRVEFSVSLSDYARVLCLPVPEKLQKLCNYCFIPKDADLPAAAPAAANRTAEPIVFTLPAGAPLKNATIAPDWPEHILPRPSASSSSSSAAAAAASSPLDELLASISNTEGGPSIDRPDANLFVSAFPEVKQQGKKEKAYHVKAHVGTKDGFLFFLSTGIFFGFKKPVKFVPLDRIESTAFVRPVSRTFGLAITYSSSGGGGGEEENEEIEFDQIDNAEHSGINQYIQQHGIQDGSFSEARKAKLGKKDGSKPGQTSSHSNGADGEGEDEENDGRTELEKAEQQLQDEEDEMEEDYDPDEDDAGSGSESESEDENEEGQNKDLVAEELGSEAEAVSDDDDEDEEAGEEGEDEEEEEEEEEEEPGDQRVPVKQGTKNTHHPLTQRQPAAAAVSTSIKRDNEPDPEDEDQL